MIPKGLLAISPCFVDTKLKPSMTPLIFSISNLRAIEKKKTVVNVQDINEIPAKTMVHVKQPFNSV